MSSRGDGFVTSVGQLKLALTGASPTEADDPQGGNYPREDVSSSESMASYDLSASEFSFNPPHGQTGVPPETPKQQTHPRADSDTAGSPNSAKRSISSAARKNSTGDMGPLSSNPSYSPGSNSNGNGNGNAFQDDESDEAIPPVPPLPAFPLTGGDHPATVVPPITFSGPLGRVSDPSSATRRNLKSRGGESVLSSLLNDELQAPALDLHSMLKGIDSRGGEHSLGNVARPPY